MGRGFVTTFIGTEEGLSEDHSALGLPHLSIAFDTPEECTGESGLGSRGLPDQTFDGDQGTEMLRTEVADLYRSIGREIVDPEIDVVRGIPGTGHKVLDDLYTYGDGLIGILKEVCSEFHVHRIDVREIHGYAPDIRIPILNLHQF